MLTRPSRAAKTRCNERLKVVSSDKNSLCQVYRADIPNINHCFFGNDHKEDVHQPNHGSILVAGFPEWDSQTNDYGSPVVFANEQSQNHLLIVKSAHLMSDVRPYYKHLKSMKGTYPSLAEALDHFKGSKGEAKKKKKKKRVALPTKTDIDRSYVNPSRNDTVPKESGRRRSKKEKKGHTLAKECKQRFLCIGRDTIWKTVSFGNILKPQNEEWTITNYMFDATLHSQLMDMSGTYTRRKRDVTKYIFGNINNAAFNELIPRKYCVRDCSKGGYCYIDNIEFEYVYEKMKFSMSWIIGHKEGKSRHRCKPAQKY